MALPPPQHIANLLVECGTNEEYIKLEDVVFDLFQNKFKNFSSEEIWDYIEKYKVDIADELFIKESDSAIDCVPIYFDIDEDHGNYHIKFTPSTEITLLRQLNQDTPSNFELFCSKILSELGAKVETIGGCDDGGIDFFATDLSLGGLPELSTLGSRILVIGQAKRYKKGNHIKIKELREFVGSAMKKVDELRRRYNDRLGVLHPVVLAFWTTSDFHPEAKKYAKEIGIWYLNGLALCKLAQSIGLEC